ncbi:zinc ribbon domain-containing protein [Parabacteroides sp. OttesenSCG-928-N08]|nr:zinc ribbon domain-containing protein [Parabacteroides sp. OttesenSCG-928-N08]
MRKCPVCEESLPLLSKICPICGNVIETEQTDSFDTLNQRLGNLLKQIQLCSSPSFSSSIGAYKSLFYFVLLLALSLFAILMENIVLAILSLVVLLLFCISLFRLLKGKNGKAKENKRVQELSLGFDSIHSEMSAYFGKDREVSKHLEKMAEEKELLLEKRKRTSALYGAIALVVALAVAALIVFFVFDYAKKSVHQEVYTGANGVTSYLEDQAFEKAIALYPKVVSETLDEGEALRTQIIQQLLMQDQIDKAIDFYHLYCPNKPSDYALAQDIAAWLLRNQQQSKAMDFVESITDLRYKSDLRKLQELVTK